MRSKVARKSSEQERTPSVHTSQVGSWCEGGRSSGVRAVTAVAAVCGALYAACWDSRAFALLVCVLSLLAILVATRPDSPTRPTMSDLPEEESAK